MTKAAKTTVVIDGDVYKLKDEELTQEVSDLKSAIETISIGTYKYDDLTGYYVNERTGALARDNGFTASSKIDISDELVLQVLNVGKRSIWNVFYDENEDFISNFVCEIGNNYIAIPSNAKYCVISNETAYYTATIMRKRTRIVARSYDVYIAGSNSSQKLYADYVASGTDDDVLINILLSNAKIKSAYFFGDSTFSLNAPIVLKSGMRIKSNGATFTQPVMITESVTGISASSSDNTMTVAAPTNFKKGQYLYYQDSRGNYSRRVVQSIRVGGGNAVITFTTVNGSSVDPQYNPVLKTANPCFVLPGIENVVIDGITIDWNVAENPIQTYNPDYLQEGISIQNGSNNIVVKNCTVKNGGRRGIYVNNSKDVLIDGCFISGWHEHAIDVFNGTTGESTLENPMINNVIISNCICSDNKMFGIQLHRGSGCTIISCVCYDNVEAGIGLTEYARHNLVSDCQLHDNTTGIVIRSGAKQSKLSGNNIFNNTDYGVNIIGTGTRCADISIINNKFDNNGRHCVFSNTNDRIEIVSNTMHYTAQADGDKAVQASFSTSVDILSNVIYNDSEKAFELIRCGGAGTDYCAIIGNIIHGSSAQPTSAGTHDTISNNILFAG